MVVGGFGPAGLGGASGPAAKACSAARSRLLPPAAATLRCLRQDRRVMAAESLRSSAFGGAPYGAPSLLFPLPGTPRPPRGFFPSSQPTDFASTAHIRCCYSTYSLLLHQETLPLPPILNKVARFFTCYFAPTLPHLRFSLKVARFFIYFFTSTLPHL